VPPAKATDDKKKAPPDREGYSVRTRSLVIGGLGSFGGFFLAAYRGMTWKMRWTWAMSAGTVWGIGGLFFFSTRDLVGGRTNSMWAGSITGGMLTGMLVGSALKGRRFMPDAGAYGAVLGALGQVLVEVSDNGSSSTRFSGYWKTRLMNHYVTMHNNERRRKQEEEDTLKRYLEWRDREYAKEHPEITSLPKRPTSE